MATKKKERPKYIKTLWWIFGGLWIFIFLFALLVIVGVGSQVLLGRIEGRLEGPGGGQPEGVHVSTAEAFRGIVPKAPAKPLAAVLRQDPASWQEELVNDFEATVFAKYPSLRQYKAGLYGRGALYAAMSGSGSALFGLFPA